MPGPDDEGARPAVAPPFVAAAGVLVDSIGEGGVVDGTIAMVEQSCVVRDIIDGDVDVRRK